MTSIIYISGGQTEAEITLKPGQHTLQLLTGDKDHIPHTPPVMSQRIRVRVEGTPEAAALTGGPSPSSPGAGGDGLRKDGSTTRTVMRFDMTGGVCVIWSLSPKSSWRLCCPGNGSKAGG
jgi:hypothetical protein